MIDNPYIVANPYSYANRPGAKRRPHDDAAMAIGEAIGLDRAQRGRSAAGY